MALENPWPCEEKAVILKTSGLWKISDPNHMSGIKNAFACDGWKVENGQKAPKVIKKD